MSMADLPTPQKAQRDEPATPALVEGKIDGMIVHVEHPVQMETPLEILRQSRFTDVSYMFVRNNQDLAGHFTTEPSPVPLERWQVEVGGLVSKPGSVLASDLLSMATTAMAEVEMVMQCSGNSRAFFSRAAAVSGAQWQHGTTANVLFRGVPLRRFLERFGVKEEAGYLTATGRDTPATPGAPDFERSMPLHEVIDSGLVALEMNGLPLPAAHGGPLRLVLPGFYSVNSVKWLRRLRLEASPTLNHYQTARYRVPKVRLTPGQDFVFTEENSRPDWLQNVKSFIWAPLDGERLRPGETIVSGPAWTAGRSHLGGVELSLDRGKSWRKAALDMSTSPYGWSLWRLPVVLEAGEHDLWARAFDASGKRQPLDGTEFWNPSGYEWNGVHKIRVTVA